MPTLLLGAFLLGWAPVRAQAQDTVRETREAAQMLLAKGDFANAVPLLEQLIEWFSSSTKANTVNELENVYYNLSLCHFFLGQFDQSHKTMGIYLQRYKRFPRAPEVAMYVGDALRFQNRLDDALRAYQDALKQYTYNDDLTADLYASMARCHLARSKWTEAVPPLLVVYRVAPDLSRKNWAATLLTVAWLKVMDLENVYRVMPFLLTADSFASRSVAMNMTALEAGDLLFSDEKYRDALWVYRMVYPYEELKENSQAHYESLQRLAARLRRNSRSPRRLMRAQEHLGEMEAEIKAMETVENYDDELFYRVARSYMEIRRFREAGDSFYRLYQDGLKDKDEECLYFSFFCAMQYQPWATAYARGRVYMTKYPAKEYYDTVSLAVAQMYAQEKNWKKVIETLREALQVSPKHQDIAECLFLLGYACFMEEQFDESVQHLERLNNDFPGNERAADGYYWCGMSYLFNKNYEKAMPNFDRVVQEFRDSVYVEDASFRSATCDYGLSRFLPAEEKLLAFVGRFTESKLLGEAYVMLGDIAGQNGDAEEAIRRLTKALTYDLNIELYNHANFRSTEMLNDLQRYDDILAIMKRYLDQNREDSNIPMAIYWVGRAYWELGRKADTLAFYMQAIRKHGNERRAIGADLIVEQWIGRTREAGPELARASWSEIRALLNDAVQQRQDTLALRCEEALRHSPDVTDAEKALLLKTILQERNLIYASPMMLEIIMDESLAAGDQALALKAAQTVIKDFPETDTVLRARMIASDDALARGEFEEAVKHLTVIREVFASSPQAAEALLKLGELYQQMRKYEDADIAYKDVLGVKAWRPSWPAALYGRGQNAMAQRKYPEASVYFERIYVLYLGYRPWAAKAYLARADALQKMREYRKATETLNEMVRLPDFEGMPERGQAEAMLQQLKGNE